jgi:hypothetical protein
MFEQSPRPVDGAGKGSVFYRSVAAIGNGIGAGSAILLTPLIFNATRDALLVYLTKTWGAGLGHALTWMMGAVEAGLIFFCVKLAFVSLVTFAAAAIAARGFPGMR